MLQPGDNSRRPIRAAQPLLPLVAFFLATTSLVPSAAAQFFETSSLRASYTDFSTPQIYVNQPSGFETVSSRSYGTIPTPAPSESDPISFVRLTFDTPRDGVVGNSAIVDGQGNIIAVYADFDDLHEFNIAFDDRTIGQVGRSQAVDLVYVTWLSDQQHAKKQLESRLAALRVSQEIEDPVNQRRFGGELFEIASAESMEHELASPSGEPGDFEANAPSGFALLVGVRGVQAERREGYFAEGGLLGGFSTNTYTDNDVVGPKAGLAWCWQFGPLSINLQGSALAGYNFGNIKQETSIGEEFIPGATNRPLYATHTKHYRYESASRFSPSGELLAETKWQITDAFALRFSWSGVVVENVMLTDDRVVWGLPDMGLQDPGNQRLTVHTFFCGLEFVH